MELLSFKILPKLPNFKQAKVERKKENESGNCMTSQGQKIAATILCNLPENYREIKSWAGRSSSMIMMILLLQFFFASVEKLA